ncbi:MAG: hypothetical protein ACOVOV_00605 [Dolichospermum sp.]
MELNKKYIEFMLDNVIDSSIRVQLPNPQEDGKLFWTKLGPVVYIKVDLKVIEKYSRSVKFKLKFDKYEIEQLIFLPIESSPMSIKEKLVNKLEKLVCKTFLEDGRQEDMKQMYEEKRKTMFAGIEKLVGKVNTNYVDIKHCPHLGLLNFEGDLFRVYDLLDGRFTIVNEKHKDVVTTDAHGILEYMEGPGKPIVNYDGKTWIIPEQHENARPTKDALYKFLKLELLVK